MVADEDFDAFYRETRRRLLLQTFALTGDLAAARSAVQDAYCAAWHHWRKVRRLEDPSEWVRPRAWRLARRRHAARPWRGTPRRARGRGPEHAHVLAALARLRVGERKALLLTQLSRVSRTQLGRELGVPLRVAEQRLQRATAALALSLDTDATAVRSWLEGLARVTDDAVLARASSLRRAGTKRRQAHTAVAAAGAVLLTVGAGAVVHPLGGSTLAAGGQADPAASIGAGPGPEAAAPGTTTPEGVAVHADQLLDVHQIQRLGRDQPWRIVDTGDNTTGDGINTLCQGARFADPDGVSALVRRFVTQSGGRRTAVQTVEVSRNATRAQRTFDVTLGWYAGCRAARLRLDSAYRVSGVGDQARILLLRSAERPTTTYTVAVARSGDLTSATVSRSVRASPPPMAQVAQSLADSVAMLCPTSGSQRCAPTPRVRPSPPPPSGAERGMLAVVDLPPVGRVDRPWTGTDAARATRNHAATTCDHADFSAAGARRTRTRTFLIPGAGLPDRFGLTETYGRFHAPRAAKRFVGRVTARMRSCPDRDPTSSVTRIGGPGAVRAWRLRTEVSDSMAVTFRMGLVRRGNRVAQLGFAGAPRAHLTDAEFTTLLRRAATRLGELGR